MPQRPAPRPAHGRRVVPVALLALAGMLVSAAAVSGSAAEPARAPAGDERTPLELLRAGRLADARQALDAISPAADPVGRFVLARMQAEGLGGPRDPAAARTTLEPLAATMFPAAKRTLALLLRDGAGGAANPAEAVRRLREARDLGDVAALAELGRAHARGEGVERDLPEAFAHLLIASLNQSPQAEAYLSELVSVHGITREQMDEGGRRRTALLESITRGMEAAPDALRPAVDLDGFVEAAAARADAAYTEERFPEAYRVHRDLADAVPGRGDSMFYLARMLERGLGVPADQPQAAHWYTQAVQAGVPVAAFNLAWMYEEGRGVPQADLAAATALFEAAATRGWWDAMVETGLRMLSRNGYEQLDPVAAGALLLIAAEDGGRDRARELLAQAEEYGDISPEDLASARTRADELRRAIADGTAPPPPLHLMIRTSVDGAHMRTPPTRLADPVSDDDRGNVRPAPAGNAAAPPTSDPDVIELVPFTVTDPAMDGLVAFEGLMPRGWTRYGGVQWTNHLQPFVRPWFSLVGPDGREVSLLGGYGHSHVEASPGVLEQMRRGGVELPPPGQPQLDGTIFLAPPRNVAAYVTGQLIPAARPKASEVRLVGTEPMPEVAGMLERMMAPLIAGTRSRDANLRQLGAGEAPPPHYEATLVRIEYVEDGTRFREEVPMLYMLMQQTLRNNAGATRTSWWTAFPIGSIRSPAATFEADRPLLLSIMSGITRGDGWGLRIDAMQRQLQEAQLRASRADLAERERLFQQTQASIRDASEASLASLRESYETQRASEERMQRSFIEMVQDVAAFEGPSGSRVTVPAAYPHVYTDGAGRYLLSGRVLVDDAGLTKLLPAR